MIRILYGHADVFDLYWVTEDELARLDPELVTILWRKPEPNELEHEEALTHPLFAGVWTKERA